MKNEICFRCNTSLIITDQSKAITFDKCDKCKRAYAKSVGKSLTDRWLSPISIAMYYIIFATQKVPDKMIKETANEFLERFGTKKINILLEDIDEEINNPKQKLVDMLDLKGTEEIARDYLRRLSIEIKKKLLC